MRGRTLSSSLSTEPETRPVVIIGAGPHGKVVLEVLRAQKAFRAIGFLDDAVNKHNTSINGVPVLGSMDWLRSRTSEDISVIVAIGNNNDRITIGDKIRASGKKLINAIYPSAIVMDGAHLGNDILICAGSVIVTGTQIEDDVVVNTGATIDHDSILRQGAYISPGVHTAGCVTVNKGAFVGLGAILGPKITIGEHAIIGAGSIVLSDVPARMLVYGSPAKVIRELDSPVDWHHILSGQRSA